MTSPILLVEDNTDDILLIKEAFSMTHMVNPLKVAKDGEEAKAYLSKETANKDRDSLPPLVLMDLNLPGMSGFQVLEWIRSQPHLEALAVVVLTSSDNPSDLKRAFDLGATECVVKPINFTALLDFVRSLKTILVRSQN